VQHACRSEDLRASGSRLALLGEAFAERECRFYPIVGVIWQNGSRQSLGRVDFRFAYKCGEPVRRRMFGVFSVRLVYLDNNATTPVAPEVREAMLPFLGDLWSNPSSSHSAGRQVREHIERARQQVADLVGADPSEIVFTSGGTESNNLAIRGVLEAAELLRLVTTSVEHLSVLEVCRRCAPRVREYVELPVDRDGQLDLDLFEEVVGKGPALVSVMWANNETGVIFPIERIAEISRQAGCILHVDAVQVAGKLQIDVRKVPIDLLSLSAHKIYGPKGIGALFVRRGVRVQPLIAGGHQEYGRRGGTENVPGIVGFGRACSLVAADMQQEAARIALLRDRLEAGVLASCPDTRVNGGKAVRLPNTLNLSFEGVEGQAVVRMLDEYGIAASTGSACTSGQVEPSHVLRAMGVPVSVAAGAVRLSLGRYNTAEDMDYVLDHLPGIISTLQTEE